MEKTEKEKKMHEYMYNWFTAVHLKCKSTIYFNKKLKLKRTFWKAKITEEKENI